MLNNVALDVAIGMVFVFLLYSILAAIINEIFAHIFSLRARMLYKSIRRMIEDGTGQGEFIKTFYEHPSIKYLSENKIFDKPSYLKTQTFAQSLIHLIRGKDYDNSKNQMESIRKTLDAGKLSATVKIAAETQTLLQRFFTDSQGDVDRFKARLESWFDEMMERTTGWYKRQSQAITFSIGLILSIAFNIDTIKLCSILSTNETAREQMVELAIKSKDNYGTAIDKLNNDTASSDARAKYIAELIQKSDSVSNKTDGMLRTDLEKTANVLGMGWRSSSSWKLRDSLRTAYENAITDLEELRKDSIANRIAIPKQKQLVQELSDKEKAADAMVYDDFDWSSIVGWLLTALALSFGAPFWFDLLNKLVNLRATGQKPKDAEGTGDRKSDPKTESMLPTLRKG